MRPIPSMLLDATIIHGVLPLATMTLLGRRNRYLPRLQPEAA